MLSVIIKISLCQSKTQPKILVIYTANKNEDRGKTDIFYYWKDDSRKNVIHEKRYGIARTMMKKPNELSRTLHTPSEPERPQTAAIWYLYVIRTAGNMLYTGITTDVNRRLTQHEKGNGAKALRGKGPLRLVFSGVAGTHGEALRLEYRLKRMNKKQKERLIADQPTSLAGWLAEC